ESKKAQEIKILIRKLLGRNFERAGEELRAKSPFVEDEFKVESARQRRLKFGEFSRRKTFRGKALVIDRRRMLQGAMPRRIGHDLVDFVLAIAERAQTFGHGAIDNLEITATRKFLEFDEREIRLDACRVAIHH